MDVKIKLHVKNKAALNSSEMKRGYITGKKNILLLLKIHFFKRV